MKMDTWYVLTSRVRTAAALRLMQYSQKELEKLAELLWNEELCTWDAGYDEDGVWSDARAIASALEVAEARAAAKAREDAAKKATKKATAGAKKAGAERRCPRACAQGEASGAAALVRHLQKAGARQEQVPHRAWRAEIAPRSRRDRARAVVRRPAGAHSDRSACAGAKDTASSGAKDTAVEAPYVAHALARVAELRALLESSAALTVVIAADRGKLSLGKGLAVGQWKGAFGQTRGAAAHARFVETLDASLDSLRRDYGARVTLGRVGGASVSATCIHVWGANASNWRLPNGTDIQGEGQARAMAKMRDGVFGIVTTPLMGAPTPPPAAPPAAAAAPVGRRARDRR